MMREWADLPEELLDLILSNLYGQDRNSFKLVCRSWKTASLISPHCYLPSLMFYERAKSMWKVIQYNNGFYYMDFPKAKIRCSKYGWLLMSGEDDDTLYFFDPFNNQRRDLPKSASCYKIICFFHEPTSLDYIIVGMGESTCGVWIKIGVLQVNNGKGEDEWKREMYRNNKTCFYLSICNPVLHDGKLYCLDVKGNIGTFDINNYKQIVCDELCTVVTQEERVLGVFRLSERDRKWEQVQDLGDNMLFVLPVMIDVGTNNEKLLKDPPYLGLPEHRLDREEYLAVIDEFMEALPMHIGDVQFEDFQSKWAFKLLQCYRNEYRMFNGDVQELHCWPFRSSQSTRKIVVAGAGGVLNAARKTMEIQKLPLKVLGVNSGLLMA
ncbi:hypothetical protein BUALT_Bualt19G0026300 [Buddleja alternifolia]|uniref:F-box domain-containing protein n=1 Tax=Buddleja alternifolia TaxID=168488 RepID=A0AAV6W922_9LAMI|nr:hypothetical protein BUALT_Bualt19G0026300 [Buddleja alternifolia]